VDKIEVAVVRDATQHRVMALEVDAVPAHVRNFQIAWQPSDLSWYKTQAGCIAFFRPFHQQLEAEADA
jgi:hypothetical protein